MQFLKSLPHHYFTLNLYIIYNTPVIRLYSKNNKVNLHQEVQSYTLSELVVCLYKLFFCHVLVAFYFHHAGEKDQNKRKKEKKVSLFSDCTVQLK